MGNELGGGELWKKFTLHPVSLRSFLFLSRAAHFSQWYPRTIEQHQLTQNHRWLEQ